MQKDPFWDFEELGEGIHLHRPPSSAPTNLSLLSTASSYTQPGLVICCVWLFAAARHAAKYIRQYQLIYPNARILLLQNNLMNVTLTPDWIQMQALSPAVEAVKDFLVTERDPTILVHVFSGGGAHSAVQLAQAYHEDIGYAANPSSALPPEIPISALVLDSCPPHGNPPLHTAAASILSFIPKTSVFTRVIACPFAWGLIGGCALFNELGLVESSPSKIWRCLNDPEGPFLKRSDIGHDHNIKIVATPGAGGAGREKIIPRTYIFSKEDQLVPHEHVVLHAAEARRHCGLLEPSADAKDAVRLEEFMGSMHVNHVSLDPVRYWRLVTETVERSAAM